MSQEVVTWQVGETKILRLDSVKFQPNIEITDPDTGQLKTIDGLVFHAWEENGHPVAKFWRLIQKRTIGTVRPLVEDGTILRRAIKVTRPGAGVRFDLEISVAPEGYVFHASDVKPGPFVASAPG